MKNIFIYAGYAPGAWNGSNYQEVPGCRGSEIALVHIAEGLAKVHNVTVSYDPIISGRHNNVNYLQPGLIQNYLDNTEVDVLIISRYTHFFVKYTNTAKKTYLWLHDYEALPYYYGQSLPQGGKPLVKNAKLDGIVTLTEWHKNHVRNFYDLKEGLNIIGNGITAEKFANYNPQNKIKDRFVFFSGNGGLTDAIQWFLKFKAYRPAASLHVFMNYEKVNEWERSMSDQGVIYRGIIPNDELIQELLLSEYWIYPATVNETFCTSILEAKAAGCIPIVRLQGGMQDVIGDAYFDIDDPNSIQNVLNIKDIDTIRSNNREDALKYTWDRRVAEWCELTGIENHIVPENLSNELEDMSAYIQEIDKINIQPQTVLEIGSRDANHAEALRLNYNIDSSNVYVVEPNPKQHGRIALKYPKINLIDKAISDKPGKLDFYQINSGHDKWDGASSLLNRPEIYSQQFSNTEVIQVECITGQQLLKQINKEIDICKIDVEGLSYEVLISFGKDISKIKTLHIETEQREVWEGQKLDGDIKVYLESMGFVKVYNKIILTRYGEQYDQVWIQSSLI